jgi:hypothetical protein
VEIGKEKREKEKQKIFRGSPVKYCLLCGQKNGLVGVTGSVDLRN